MCQYFLNKWKTRNLTFYGKIMIIKSLILPKLTCLLQSLYLPKAIADTANRLFIKFLWNDKNEKIKRNILIGKRLKGGLEMIESLKLKWVKSLKDNYTIKVKFYLNQYGKDLLIFDMNLDSFKSLPSVRYSIPDFYKGVIEAWIEISNERINYSLKKFCRF